MNVIDTARIWREQTGNVGCGGVIVVYAGDVQGWVDVPRNPENWVPGCVAVAEDGRTWTTFGGNSKHGALMWLPNDPIAD
jgi:hypothetical protein